MVSDSGCAVCVCVQCVEVGPETAAEPLSQILLPIGPICTGFCGGSSLWDCFCDHW